MRDISELDQKAQLLGTYWKKAHNYYACLAKLAREIKLDFDRGLYDPKWNFSMWMGQKAHLNDKQVFEMLKVFERVLAGDEKEFVDTELKKKNAARMEAAQQRKKESEEIKATYDQARAIRDSVKAAKAKERHNASSRASKARARQRAKRQAPTPGATESLPGLVIDMKTGLEHVKHGLNSMQHGRAEWIEGTMQAAVALAKARMHFQSDAQFSDWLDQNKVEIAKNDRAALIQFGMQPELARQVLMQTDRTSYQLIWEKEMKPLSKVVSII